MAPLHIAGRAVGPGQPVLFSASDGVSGREAWVTDGTTAGAQFLSDIAPGPESGNPRQFVLSGSRVYFGAMGSEELSLWSVPWVRATEAGSCRDGVDNDSDGRIDCADDECTSAIACLSADPDADGVPTRDDCAPLDPRVHAVPVEIDALTIQRLTVPGGVVLDWDDRSTQAGTATVYDVASGLLSNLPGGAPAGCLARDLTVTVYFDGSTAPAGDGFYYLVRARNSCGPAPGEGWGRDSLGAPRPACP